MLLFDSEVSVVTDYLRTALDISAAHSRIAGAELDLDKFGYRSVHLVARFRGRTAPNYVKLKRLWVEVQVRSLLQHAWAAIGHLPVRGGEGKAFVHLAGLSRKNRRVPR